MKRRAFTLVELLVSIGIIASLAVVASLGLASMLDRGRMVREIAAAHTLITAVNFYANDHDGRYLPAIDKTAGSTANPVWYEPEKRYITYMEAPHRYPFRLAPYFDYRINGVILLNGSDQQLTKIFGKSGGLRDYGVSLCPAFGMNYQFFGGYLEPSGQLDYSSQNEAVTRSSQADRSILIFASAGGTPDESTVIKGYFKIDAPTSTDATWSPNPWAKGGNAGDYGAVDARYQGRAVCAFLDGSVKLKTIEELRDMRLWSRNAAIQNNPNYRAAR